MGPRRRPDRAGRKTKKSRCFSAAHLALLVPLWSLPPRRTPTCFHVCHLHLQLRPHLLPRPLVPSLLLCPPSLSIAMSLVQDTHTPTANPSTPSYRAVPAAASPHPVHPPNNNIKLNLSPHFLQDPINISLQPPPSSSSKRGHRHRRSAAMSGDFDVAQFLQPPIQSSPNPMLSKSLPASPIKNNNNNNILTNNTTNLNNIKSISDILDYSPPTTYPITTPTSTPLRLYLTDETRFSDSNSNIPDALIDLDAINSPSTTVISSSLPNNFALKHSSFISSPKKSDIIITEEISEENSINFELQSPSTNNDSSDDDDDDDNNGNANANANANTNNNNNNNPSYENITSSSQCDYNAILMSKNLNNSLTSLTNQNSTNSSTHSLPSNINNSPFTNLNTPSISSLKGKVRYQSYYNNYNNNLSLTPSTPKNNHSHHIHRLTHSASLSPIKPSLKSSPFQYQSLQYDLPDDFHQKTFEYGDDIIPNPTPNPNVNNNKLPILNLNNSSSFKILSDSNSTLSNTSNITNVKIQPPPQTSNSASVSVSVSTYSKHERSSSLFSLLSKKISHHKRKSSLLSIYSKKSIPLIEQSNDELLGLNINSQLNDSTLNEDFTLTHDNYLGEPGPMVEINSNDLNRFNNVNTSGGLSPSISIQFDNQSLKENTNTNTNANSNSNSNTNHNTSPSTSTFASPTNNKHQKKGLFGWIVKSKRSHNNGHNRTHSLTHRINSQ